ncbi:glycosyltransferase [Chryseobacterium wangxinyae]|uniref:glycosyltransferase n=1 Tax=Chryseobacterium sp. CY353 TaxID=2997334 RepID=UPI002D1E4AD9|nr:glycosyltransferase [Chryseobacterium sp. CY353]
MEKNIIETCDVPYEIIPVLNPNLYSITKAYNIGISKARYDIFLFIHEDILFHTKNWGSKLVCHLRDSKTGVVGIAGSSYVPKAPCGWHVSESKYNHVNYIQNDKSGDNGVFQSTFSKNIKKTEVFAVDGVFMASNSKVARSTLFNENIKGFHGYDLDFSLRIAEDHQNYIINDILIEHFSKGYTDKVWFINNMQIRISTQKLRYQDDKDSVLETNTFSEFFTNYMKYFGISLKTIYETFKFYPLMSLKFSQHILIAKLVFYHIKYKKNYHEKYKITQQPSQGNP